MASGTNLYSSFAEGNKALSEREPLKRTCGTQAGSC
jgi:hypothetical protein